MVSELKPGSVKMVLQWNEPETKLDLYASSNYASDNECLVSYFNEGCRGIDFSDIHEEAQTIQAIEVSPLGNKV